MNNEANSLPELLGISVERAQEVVTQITTLAEQMPSLRGEGDFNDFQSLYEQMMGTTEGEAEGVLMTYTFLQFAQQVLHIRATRKVVEQLRTKLLTNLHSEN